MIRSILNYFRRDRANSTLELKVQSRMTLDIVESIREKREQLEREFPVASLIERKSHARSTTISD